MRVLGVLRAVAVLHAVTVCLQPLLAGIYLNGSTAAARLHGPVGLTAAGLCATQLTLAILWWRASGPGWPVVLSAAVLAGEALMIHAGFGRELALHLPIGMAVVAGSVSFAAWAARARRTAVAA
ncbi:hypothetical protein Kfla_5957 [Kribbella flavida DSM 17836]|uniref:Integral membrane protein n=1 Tax=Kribbella flavida (strain DSM 17836 / JCM 10339 / NBRC 14399) TaxID=479435 RepID=D2PRP3_KRIFD|nr:hypothetical protein [Kribbella flavida]ADB34961.1 hypothetical protein Kfla_5957 [Kribbella flavida DSM 17836]